MATNGLVPQQTKTESEYLVEEVKGILRRRKQVLTSSKSNRVRCASVAMEASHPLTHLIKFLLRIRGALTAAPTRELPVSQIPHAAPTTEKPNPKAIPKLANPYGERWESTSDHPALQ